MRDVPVGGDICMAPEICEMIDALVPGKVYNISAVGLILFSFQLLAGPADAE